jgi:hypothetical protein
MHGGNNEGEIRKKNRARKEEGLDMKNNIKEEKTCRGEDLLMLVVGQKTMLM